MPICYLMIASKFAAQKEILQAVLQHPYNRTCADCDASSPSWASLQFGVLVCQGCFGSHRALGAHVTRVKSVHLDLWKQEWYENMFFGNERMNAYWESEPSFIVEKPKKGAHSQRIRQYVVQKYIGKKYASSLQKNPITAYSSQRSYGHKEPRQMKMQHWEGNHQQRQGRMSKEGEGKGIFEFAKDEINLLDLSFLPIQSPKQQLDSQSERDLEVGGGMQRGFIDFDTFIRNHKQGQSFKEAALRWRQNSSVPFI